MKFKDKKTGKIFGYKEYVFCGKYDGMCPNCPIFSRLENLDGGAVDAHCDKWISSHLKEAAELMGYEVIDEGDTFEPTRHREVTRKSILQKAEKCVCGDREQDYGSPENSFRVIAAFWTNYIAEKCATPKTIIDIGPEDVAAMMVLFKIARVATGHNKEDNWCDVAGYAACGGELEGRENIDTPHG